MPIINKYPLSRTSVVAKAKVSDILIALATKVGMQSYIDVSTIGDNLTIRGLSVTDVTSVRNTMETLMKACFIDKVETNGKIYFIPRSSEINNFIMVNNVIEYTFDSVSGTTVNDTCGNGFNSTMSGSSIVSGHIGNCVSFDGSNDNMVSNSQIDLFGTNDNFSVSFWVYPNASQNSDATLIDYSNSLNQNFTIKQDGANTNRIYMIFYDGSSWEGSSLAYTLTDSVWTHLVWIRQDKKLKLFVNGELGKDQSLTLTAKTLTSAKTYLRLGGRASDRYFGGKIDQFRVFSRYLSNEEVGSLYLES